MKKKNVLLCVTGGIAVYKAADLTSKLVQSGFNVKVIMSDSAKKFVTPLTFQALSRNEVFVDTFIENNPGVIAHIDLADWADLILVAPATANTIGKLANGIADDMVTTTLLASAAPVWIAPAMNVHMYGHPAVKKNMETLMQMGCNFLEPGEGYLACGYVGKGRLEEPAKILELVKAQFESEKLFASKTFLITAGPTKEKIDPVRYFTNRSSGKMGYALAEQAALMGAKVILVTGTNALPEPKGVKVIHVESAADMYDEVMAYADEADVIIKSAAVADYRPKLVHDSKMKKQAGDMAIELERTKDILFELGQKKKHQFLVGFAAETDNMEEYAKNKLIKKNADMIVANNVAADGAGFAGDTNIVTIFHKDLSSVSLPLLSKQETARRILLEISEKLGDDCHL
ncbi:bifunctional phosphopantothenoylcysteine decarboxylase/phosphopantothenate--cysteine ligase CoaBC [Siminovitchia fortis]|uniref:Coenzyme A biosynthesis bifunctional protein CoaBC n=1 Tax=Siminovitchia fortis TaxID=254758 RepID=A0A443J0E6_9BACI|nr:bifunctional phosphopantothenoylcysteine decarboxylase/phosphopantothenate--cysteine ligase CoaBC [Siminovitchia fortis]RWR14078.1 bifunctional phosphopantothenoylcysteine decarboxylase/phosphopantothenate--cysteine ligase CoaBC [Siminovitchia fortis]WHY83351.1 bifunctional phosphopantothenoylcysteine decarboxylase/phosphopantothenate--cysteine ligase CoaBC [Siminovitchia fortis]